VKTLYVHQRGRQGLGLGVVKLQALIGVFLGVGGSIVAFVGAGVVLVLALFMSLMYGDLDEDSLLPAAGYMALSAVIVSITQPWTRQLGRVP